MWDRDGNLIRYNASERVPGQYTQDSSPSWARKLIRFVLRGPRPHNSRRRGISASEKSFEAMMFDSKDYHDFTVEAIKIIREAGLDHKMSARFRAFSLVHIQREAIFAEADRKREAQSQLARQAMSRLKKEEIEAIRREQ